MTKMPIRLLCRQTEGNMATNQKIRFRGYVKNIKDEMGYYGRTLKVTIIGDDGNTYWFSSTAKFVWKLILDETVLIDATEKDRRDSRFGDGEFVVVKRPVLVESEGTEERRAILMQETAAQMRAQAEEVGNQRALDALDELGYAPESAQEPPDEDDFSGLLEAAKARLRAKAPKPTQEDTVTGWDGQEHPVEHEEVHPDDGRPHPGDIVRVDGTWNCRVESVQYGLIHGQYFVSLAGHGTVPHDRIEIVERVN